MTSRLSWPALAGALLVAALHGAVAWGLWQHRLLPAPRDATTLFVDFITPPPAQAKAPSAPPPPRPRPVAESRVEALAAATPVPSPAAPVAAPPPSAPTTAAAPAAPPQAISAVTPATVTLDAELSVSCPGRSAPGYPLLSRRMGETGTTLLRVELDEQGRVALADVATGSGHARLDAAALAAVRTWRCNAAQRNGQPVRAVALQAFKFVLQGS